MDFILQFIIIFLNLFRWIILGNLIMSFLGLSVSNPVYNFTIQVLNPLYSIVQKNIKTRFGNFDLTALICLISIDIITYFLMSLFA